MSVGMKRPFDAVDSDSDTSAIGAKRFFTSGQFSDLTIVCNGKEWKVHRYVLCGQSQFFYALCTLNFKEAHDNICHVDDDDPHVIEAVLQWVYGSDYSYPEGLLELYSDEYGEQRSQQADSFNKSATHNGRVLFDADVFIAADKFFISELKDKAASRFEANCKQVWATADFPAAIEKVFSVPAGFYTALKISVMDVVLAHATELLRGKFKYPGFHAVMRSNGDFSTAVAVAIDLKEPEKVFVEKVVEKVVQKVVDRPVDRIVQVSDPAVMKFKCPVCDQIFAVGATPTPRTQLACPRLCFKGREKTWWQKHASA